MTPKEQAVKDAEIFIKLFGKKAPLTSSWAYDRLEEISGDVEWSDDEEGEYLDELRSEVVQLQRRR